MKQNKYLYLWIIQGNYGGYGWEDLTTEDNYKSMKENLHLYREADPTTPHRAIRRRELNAETTKP